MATLGLGIPQSKRYLVYSTTTTPLLILCLSLSLALEDTGLAVTRSWESVNRYTLS
jgi:hypothetical protein